MIEKFLPIFILPSLLLADAEEAAVDSVPAEELALLGDGFELRSDLPIEQPAYEDYLRTRKNAGYAALLSSLVPGLGQAYLGDYRAAGVYLGTAGTLYGATFSGIGEWRETTGTMAQNIAGYSAYAAYRDARSYNRFEGYRYPMPRESGLALILAPFEWSVIRKPTVWGGLLGALAVGSALSYFAFGLDAHIAASASHSSTADKLFPLMAFPVGIGEEALFRGAIQSAILEATSPVAAITMSSLLFGLAHVGNAFAMDKEHQVKYLTYGIPFITASGAYMGWLTYRTNSLKESVALHSWYDFTVFLAGSLASSASIGKPSVAFSFRF